MGKPGVLQSMESQRVGHNLATEQTKQKVTQSCATLRLHGLKPTGLLCPCKFPGKNTGVGCHFLFQGIFPIQRSNHASYWQAYSLHLSSRPQKSPLNLPGSSMSFLL